MKTTKEALKYWKQMQEQEKRTPNAHIYTNIKKQGVDMKDLATTNPYLFDIFNSLFSGRGTLEIVQTWKNYKKAYEELEAQGVFNFKIFRHEVMKQKIDNFIQKVDGACLIPVSELNEVVTEKKHKDQISIQIEFNDYISLIEKYYKFNYRDFFEIFEKQNDYAFILNLSDTEYNRHLNKSPSESVIAAKICIIDDKYALVNGMPYLDFWHHLMEHDFAEVSNGSLRYLYSYYDLHEFKEDGVEVPRILFEKFRKVLFKEVSQYPYYKGQEPEEIEFYIWW